MIKIFHMVITLSDQSSESQAITYKCKIKCEDDESNYSLHDNSFFPSAT